MLSFVEMGWSCPKKIDPRFSGWVTGRMEIFTHGSEYTIGEKLFCTPYTSKGCYRRCQSLDAHRHRELAVVTTAIILCHSLSLYSYSAPTDDQRQSERQSIIYIHIHLVVSVSRIEHFDQKKIIEYNSDHCPDDRHEKIIL